MKLLMLCNMNFEMSQVGVYVLGSRSILLGQDNLANIEVSVVSSVDKVEIVVIEEFLFEPQNADSVSEVKKSMPT